MRVALFADTFMPQINGVTNTLNKLIQYYNAKGIDYKIFAPQYEGEKSEHHIERFYSLKFILYPECRVTLPNLFRVSAALSEFKPDLIHIMTEFSMGLTGLYYGKKYGIPTISNYTTNFSQYTNYYKVDFLEQRVWDYMKWFHTQNQITLCPSREAQRTLKEHGILNTDIFSRGIDFENFHPRYRSNELRKTLKIENKIVFLYVGRVSFEKDLDILSESYKAICENYGNEVALIITGAGPYLEKCKNTFPKNTIFTGFKNGKELSEIYASCDVFVCPSFTETFGNVILEAMASGLPVIGADAGGIGEIIHHRHNGLKFKKRDSKELTSCMRQIIENTSLRNQLRINGREFSLQRSWEKIFHGLMEIYCQILKERKWRTISA